MRVPQAAVGQHPEVPQAMSVEHRLAADEEHRSAPLSVPTPRRTRKPSDIQRLTVHFAADEWKRIIGLHAEKGIPMPQAARLVVQDADVPRTNPALQSAALEAEVARLTELAGRNYAAYVAQRTEAERLRSEPERASRVEDAASSPASTSTVPSPAPLRHRRAPLRPGDLVWVRRRNGDRIPCEVVG
ncbi:MAG: hypothetical protein ACLPP2_03105 [Thermoplasmata archaeon]